MTPARIRRISIPFAAKRAMTAYFNALRSLYRTWDEHGYELSGTVKDLERIAEQRLRQAHRTMVAALGGRGRRRDDCGCTLLDAGAARIVFGILEYEKRNGFLRRYSAERKAWVKPIDPAELPLELRAVHEQLRDLSTAVEALRPARCPASIEVSGELVSE